MTAPEDGALTQLYCATSTEIEAKNLRGQYFVRVIIVHLFIDYLNMQNVICLGTDGETVQHIFIRS